MEKFLTDLIERKKAEIEKLQERMNASEDINEVRSIGESLISMRNEIAEAERQLAELNKPKGEGEDRALNPMASYGMAQPASADDSAVDSRSSMEYRTAFMRYVQDGETADVLQYRNSSGKIFSGAELREAGPNVLKDVGVLLPETIIQEIMKDVEKVYGQLYSRVRKMNVRGGIKFAIGEFGASFTRITDNESGQQSDNQKGGKITGYVEFSYKLGMIRLSQSLLASIISVPVFEKELSKVIVETYVQAMDNEILNGDGGANQMEGILTEAKKPDSSRIPAGNIITFSEADMKDWKKWQELLFAKIPLSMRNLRPVFVMTPNTYEANIKTLADDNNRPVYAETFNPVDGSEKATLKAREVIFVEDGLGIENFNDASDGDYFGLYLVPDKAYAVNTNLEFAVRRFYDEDKDQWVEKALVINDGKILDPKYLYVLKKGAVTV